MSSRDGSRADVGFDLERVVVLRLSSVGDIVLTEPVISALSEALPDAEIGYAVKSRYRDLVSGDERISRIHELPDGSERALRELTREIRSVGYSAVVDLHGNLRTVRIARGARARLVSAYRKREIGDALRVRLFRGPFRASKRLVQRYIDALRPLGIQAPYRRPRFHPATEDVESSDSVLERLDLREGGYAAVVPGSVWPTKRWPASRYAELVGRIVRELELRVLLLGSDSERDLCESVAESSGPGASMVAGETSLGELAALIARASLFVGNDSGPTHVAMALGVPTVAVFGPTDPGQFDFEVHGLVYADLPCSACSFYGTRECHLKHWDCMMSITSGDVFEAAKRLLERGDSPE